MLTPNPHLIANVLLLAHTAVEAGPNLAYTQAVYLATEVAGSTDPYAFADAAGFIGAQPDTGRRPERVLAAYRAAREAAVTQASTL